MSNPSNLIRPSILEAPGCSNAQNQSARTSQPVAAPDLERLITDIVKRVVQENLATSNPDSILVTATDETIRPEHQGQTSDLDKIPDIVRSLRDFSGNPSEFGSWRKSVERVLKIYENTKGTPKYFGILSSIRNKIIGNADVVLESYNVPLDWRAITYCLNLHYADRRDITTLECQLASLVQGRRSIPEFYQEVYNHLSLILNKLSSLEMGQEALNLLTQTYRNKALDTFVKGLNGDFPKLLGIKEPSDLPQALHLCLKLENQGCRMQYSYNHNKSRKFQPPQMHTPQQIHRKPPFYPQTAFIPQETQNQQFRQFSFNRPRNDQYNIPTPNNAFPQNSNHFPKYQNSQPPRPYAPKPLPKPVPMEIDSSQQTRNVNYINRPNYNAFAAKRAPPPSNQFSRSIPNKLQRINHISQEENTVNGINNCDRNISQDDNEQTWQQYCDSYEQQEQNYSIETQNQFADIHFLD